MILQRLYALACQQKLLDDLAFEERSVPYFVSLKADGTYLGIEERRGTKIIRGKRGSEAKTVRDNGKKLRCPVAHGNTANKGFARYFVDTLPRVIPVELKQEEQQKADSSRTTFWQQMESAAIETKDPALLAVHAFGHRLQTDTTLQRQIKEDLAQHKFTLTDRCSFIWQPDGGATILERDPVRKWYTRFYEGLLAQQQQSSRQGLCQVTGQVGPLPTTHPIKLSGIPGGLPTGVSLISYDKQAFSSYGLDGTENASVGYAAADGYLRALQALIDEQLHLDDEPPGGICSRLFTAGVLFLFWTREPVDTSPMMSLETPNPQEIEKLLRAAHQGDLSATNVEANQFYLLALSANSARAMVRDYLELPLKVAQGNLGRWFSDLKIADATQAGIGQPTCRFPLSQLAVSTALDFDNIAPETPAILLHAALKNTPISESLVVACLRRLRAEGRRGFRPARLALIKLFLLRRRIPVTETLDPSDTRPAYIYGRLLNLFEQIQYAALRKVNANVVDKFYGTFSSAPALLFARLVANAQNHLRKVRSEKPKAYHALDKRLTAVMQLLPAQAPQGQLSFQDQGLFALGYYHEKARDFERKAAHKAARLATASSKSANSNP